MSPLAVCNTVAKIRWEVGKWFDSIKTHQVYGPLGERANPPRMYTRYLMVSVVQIYQGPPIFLEIDGDARVPSNDAGESQALVLT